MTAEKAPLASEGLTSPKPNGAALRNALGAVAILLLVVAAYWPALRGQFLWDDFLVVHQNPLVTGQASLRSMWLHVDFPLSTLAFWLEWQAWGQNPLGYHVVNLLLHFASALLLWRLLARLQIPAPWLAAMLFAVHPVCAGSVAWISELKNTLSLPFFLLSLLWFCQSSLCSLARRGASRVFYGLSLLAFLLALLSKTSTVMLPVVLLGLAWWQQGRITARDVLRTIPYFVLAAACGLMTILFQAQGAIAGATVQTESFYGRFLAAGMALWFYLYKALLPLNLNTIYPRWQFNPASVISCLPAVLWVGLLGLCWAMRRRWGRHLLFGVGSFTVLLFPVLGFFDMFYLTLSRVSDHFAYLPLVAVVPLVAAGLAAIKERLAPGKSGPAPTRPAGTGAASIAFPAVAVLLVSALLTLTTLRARVFVNEEVLWRDTLTKNPGAWAAHANLGWILASQEKYDEARQHLEASLAIRPANAQAHSNLGRLLSLQGKRSEAEAHFQEALKLKPRDADIAKTYATALAEQGRRQEAIAEYQRALRLRPDAEARLRLAGLWQEVGNFAEAISEYSLVLRNNPQEPEALNNLAWLLATCSDAKLRDGAAAITLAEKACRLSGNRDPRALVTLAAAYAEAGRFSDAVTTAKQATSAAKTGGDPALAASASRLLQLFQAGRPYHEPSSVVPKP